MISVTLGIGKVFGDLGLFKGPLVKSHFFQLVAFKLGFHLHLLHLVVFVTMP
jgi:hypothetical protein